MKTILSLAASAVACHAVAAGAAATAPAVGAGIETEIRKLDERIETQTLAKMQQAVERNVAWMAHALLRHEAQPYVSLQ